MSKHPLLDEEKRKLQGMTFGKKIEYIWDYYKFHILGTMLLVSMLYSVIYNIATNHPLGLYVYLLNASGTVGRYSQEELEKNYMSYAGIDPGRLKVVIDTTTTMNPYVNSEYSMAASARISAVFAAGDLDVLAADPVTFEHYAKNGAYKDLREVLSEATYRKLEDEGRIYYMELEALEAGDREKTALKTFEEAPEEETETGMAEMERFVNNTMGTPDFISREDFRAPDRPKMKEPIPVGVILNNCDRLEDAGLYPNTIGIFGFAATSKRPESAEQYLFYLLGE